MDDHSPTEKKHWVRITNTCNNRCLFCLDRDTLDGSIRSYEDVESDLKLGLERGAKRAIISGGEPTIHPRFIDIIACATEMGYNWVQTITNGRMFYYGDFLKKAVAAGLREVTFSLHGHTPELFEKMTGVADGFKQALTGLRNALSTKGLVVSVDIVVCGENAPFLKDTVLFYYALGVREFDLLYPVPFGNAWTNRDEVLFGLESAVSAVRQVLPLADSHGITFWTNRFPVSALEGFERFIQPPEKLHDEVYGRSAIYSDFLEHGTPFPCRGERCDFCNMKNFCGMLESERAAVDNKRTYVLTGENISAIESVDAGLIEALVLDPPALKDHAALRRFSSDAGVRVIYLYREIPEEFVPGAFPVEEIEISINKKTAPLLLAHGVPEIEGVPVNLALRNYASVKECQADSVSVRIFFKNLEIPVDRAPVVAGNVPPCVSRTNGFHPLNRIPPGLFIPGEGFGVEAMTDYFLEYGCYYKSSRCEGCRYYDQCPGLHINYIRSFGFSEIAGPCSCVASHE
ncbi:MAG TPA: radical SAM protein [bacterium]|nr:radical SAM protein [bacterium]